MVTVTDLKLYLTKKTSIAPLVVLRIAFGALMLFSVTRFMFKGWVYKMYIVPKFFFPYYGFDWVKALPPAGMYAVFALMLICSAGILLGAFYRVSTLLFFLCFTYVELIDKTNYLNHYYFVSLVSFMLIFVPAAKSFSLDNKIFKRPEQEEVPYFYIFIFKLQMFLVYFFAGVAKINQQWLFEAQPLKIWLPAFTHFPIIGGLVEKEWLAFVFCWFGCIYDLAIGFLLFNKRTIKIAYFLVVVFHLATSLFFNIGVFPYIMITITIVFFSPEFHQDLASRLKKLISFRPITSEVQAQIKIPRFVPVFFALFFLFQISMPFRYLLYPGKLFWTEQGYRFSWRVMLMEKAGSAFFTVKDKKTGGETIVDNKEYLTYMQEKMMSTQPDMMVDYAKFLKLEYIQKGFTDPEVHVQSFVTLNGSGTREFIDPETDLSVQDNSVFKSKKWVRSY